MADTTYKDIINTLTQLYLKDDRPWLVGFSGGKDSTMLASLIFDAILSVPDTQRKKPISMLCTDTRVEIPAIADIEEYGESHRAQGLPDDLLKILKDDLACIKSCTVKVHHAQG